MFESTLPKSKIIAKVPSKEKMSSGKSSLPTTTINSTLLMPLFSSLKSEEKHSLLNNSSHLNPTTSQKRNSKVKFKNKVTTWKSKYNDFYHRRFTKLSPKVSSVKFVEPLSKTITITFNIGTM